MRYIYQNFWNRVQRGETPIAYCLIQTPMGWRAYARKELKEVFEVAGHLADGSILADGAHLAGGEGFGVMEKAGRVISWGSLERTIQPGDLDILSSYFAKQLQTLTVEFNNADLYLSRLLSMEPFLTRPFYIYAAFEEDPPAEHIKLFAGNINTIVLSQTRMIVTAEEKG